MKMIAIIVGVILAVIMALFSICACIISSECSRYEEYHRKEKQLELDKIRNMSDAELTRFLNDVSQRNCQICCKCGKATFKPDRIGIHTYKGCDVKKLCTLCYECYINLLDYLGIADN